MPLQQKNSSTFEILMGFMLLEGLFPAIPGLTKASLLYDYLEKQEKKH